MDVSKPKTYGGSRSAKELDNLLWMLEQYFDAFNIDEDAQKIKTVPLYLVDSTMV